MYKCCYCERSFKTKPDSCPGCGSDEILYTEQKGTIIVDKKPIGGYNTGIITEKVENNYQNILGYIFVAGVIISLFKFYFFDFPKIRAMNTYNESFIDVYVATGIMIFFSCVIVYSGFAEKISSKKNLNHYRKKKKLLFKKGVLVKNLPYTKEDSTGYHHLFVKYEINGIEKTFKSFKIFSDEQLANIDNVDLIYDPNDLNNYYIDIEIY